jgi:hypothetical protein
MRGSSLFKLDYVGISSAILQVVHLVKEAWR